MVLQEEQKQTLLQILKECYDYDFSGYSGASMSRRITRFAERNAIRTFYDLKFELINNKSMFEFFVTEVTVNVTEMFRDPTFFRSVSQNVFPALRTYPIRQIWHAGCSSGEEAYSMAILLKEHDLHTNTKIYATDINQNVLMDAGKGKYKPLPFHEYGIQYKEAGGLHALDHYYDCTDDGRILMHESLRKNMVFAQHNLVSDCSFNEFNLIVCRNVMIYFTKELQERVFGLFYESLAMFGFLALGSKESMQFSKWNDRFELVDRKEKIYRKTS